MLLSGDTAAAIRKGSHRWLATGSYGVPGDLIAANRKLSQEMLYQLRRNGSKEADTEDGRNRGEAPVSTQEAGDVQR